MFLLFFLNYWLKLLITGVITQVFNSIAEHVVPIRIPSKKTKVDTEIHPVTLEAKIRKCSI